MDRKNDRMSYRIIKIAADLLEKLNVYQYINISKKKV